MRTNVADRMANNVDPDQAAPSDLGLHCFAKTCLLEYLSHIMRKPVYAICEQQRRRSACASAQSDQCLCCSLPG